MDILMVIFVPLLTDQNGIVDFGGSMLHHFE